MSEHPSSGGRPLLPGQIASWLRLVCFAAAALISIAVYVERVRKERDEAYGRGYDAAMSRRDVIDDFKRTPDDPGI